MRASARVFVIATGAALLLTGCTSTAGAKPISAASPASIPSASPTAAGVPFTCVDLAPQTDLRALAPGLTPAAAGDYGVAPPMADPWSASRVSLTQAVNPASSPSVLSAFQSGYFGCRWADSAGDAFLDVSALPDAVTAFDAQTLTNSKSDDLRSYDALGIATKSSGGCSSNHDGGPVCRIDALIGTTWFAVATSAPTGSGGGALRTALVDIATQTAKSIGAAKGLVSARPTVTSRWDRIGDCTSIASAVATQQAGLPALTRGPLDVTGADDPLVFAAITDSHAFSCGGSGPSAYVRISVTPGADWLAPLTYADATAVQTEFATATGLTEPRVLCISSDPSTCWAEGDIDHALVVVTGLASAATDAKALVSLATHA